MDYIEEYKEQCEIAHRKALKEIRKAIDKSEAPLKVDIFGGYEYTLKPIGESGFVGGNGNFFDGIHSDSISTEMAIKVVEALRKKEMLKTNGRI